MVLKKKIKIIVLLLSFSSLALFFSCEENGGWVNCDNCFPEEPLDALLEVKLTTFSYANFITTIRVYEGNLEDGNLLRSYETYEGTFTFNVPINKKYTVTSSFYYKGTYYVTTDAVTPRFRYDKSTCDNPCYYVYDTKLNLRLKYR